MLVHLITCTIDPPSELKSMHIMGENSAVCELICGNWNGVQDSSP